MKSSLTTKVALPLLAGTLLANAFVLPARAADCNEPKGVVERRACEYARKGPEALRRFVERTRTIYGLYFWDYWPANQERQTMTGKQEAKLARSDREP
jgi:hypothetical protein